MILVNANRHISVIATVELEAAWQDYRAAVEASDLSQSSQATYIDMAHNFVRWARGSFNPGSRKAPYRIDRPQTPMMRNGTSRIR
jgi:hypothetical protein